MPYQSLILKRSPLRTPPPIGLLAATVSRGIRQLLTAQLEPLGLSTREFWALVAIAEEASPAQAELAARLRTDEATACRAVRSLSEAGWVTAVRDTDDRRRVRLQLAPAGRTLARQQLLPLAGRIRSAIDAALTPEEREATRSALLKVVARLAVLASAAPSPLLAARPAPVRSRRAGPAPDLPAARAKARRRAMSSSTGRGTP